MNRRIVERIDDLRKAGILVDQEIWLGRPIYVIRTSTRSPEKRELSQMIWSMFPRRRCLITEVSMVDYITHEYEVETRFLPGYFYRIFHDGWTRIMLGPLFMVLFLLWVVLLLPFVWTFPDSYLVLLISTLIIAGVWGALHHWLKNQEGFSEIVAPRNVLGKFILGAVMGVVWLSASGAIPSAVHIFGALWIFSTSNIIWVFTVGYDRFLFENQISRVGGRLPDQDAISRLNVILQTMQSPDDD